MAAAQEYQFGRASVSVSPDRSPGRHHAWQKGTEIVTGRGERERFPPGLCEQSERPFDGSPLAREHQHSERSFGRAR